jgi:opacity protein-like surface antigen
VPRIKLVILLSLLFLTSVAAAQVPKGNLFFGYSYLRADLNSSDRSNLNGWEGSLEGKVFPFVGVVADFSGHYGTNNFPSSTAVFNVDGREHNFMFGPRVSAPVGKFRPFAHALIGAGHVSVSTQGFSASDTSLATAIGGGLDYHLVPALAWRFQGDYLQTRFFSNTQNNARFSTGIVLNF